MTSDELKLILERSQDARTLQGEIGAVNGMLAYFGGNEGVPFSVQCGRAGYRSAEMEISHGWGQTYVPAEVWNELRDILVKRLKERQDFLSLQWERL